MTDQETGNTENPDSQNRTPQNADALLRKALKGNSVFSTVSGLALLAGAEPIAAMMGIAWPSLLLATGVSLLAFAAANFRNASLERVQESEALITVAMDGAWVAGSVALLASGVLTSAGNWAVAIVADIVLAFAVLQYLGVRRIRIATGGPSMSAGLTAG